MTNLPPPPVTEPATKPASPPVTERPATQPPAVQHQVHSGPDSLGAFCTPATGQGYRKAGALYVCSPDSRGQHDRWLRP